jgi:hypothetical protein
MLVYCIFIWYILRPFGIFYGHFIYFLVICYIFPGFSLLQQELSGNPAAQVEWKILRFVPLFHKFFYRHSCHQFYSTFCSEVRSHNLKEFNKLRLHNFEILQNMIEIKLTNCMWVATFPTSEWLIRGLCYKLKAHYAPTLIQYVWDQGCQVFLGAAYQNRGKYTKWA